MMEISSGGETSGANSTSNADEHIIVVDGEPIKQLRSSEIEAIPTDLPQREMENTGQSAFILLLQRTQKELIPASAIHVSSSAPGNSGANTNPISSLPNIQNSLTLIPLQRLEEEKVMNCEGLPDFVGNYFAGNRKIRCLFQALKQRLDAADVPGEFDFEKIGVFWDFLATEKLELDRVHADQLQMWAEHQVHGNRIDAKSDRIGRWRIGSAVFFAIAAAISSAVAVVAANNNDTSTAVAGGGSAAASVLFVAAGKGMNSYLKKRERSLKKDKYVIRAVIEGAKFPINDLRAVYVLVCHLHSDTESTLKMVCDGAADVALRDKMSALNQSFQKLQMEVNLCCSRVDSVSEAVLQSIVS